MKVLVLLALVAFAAAYDFPEQWDAWKQVHGKKYDSEIEDISRHNIWQSNKKLVDLHNAQADLGKFTYRLGMNEYADLENNEFVVIMNGHRWQEKTVNNETKVYVRDPSIPLAATVDWRTTGAVTEVKNQGQCGSCWAFSSTGSLEGQHFLKKNDLVSLSEQNLCDCSTKEGNHGCQGGLMDNAFKYIKSNGGVDTEKSYPYKAHNEKCHFMKSDVGATDNGYVDIKREDEMALMEAVQKIGPISVAIDASHSSFQLYRSGVYHEARCSETRLDHGVLAVGYGTDGGDDYWLVKNSWGTSWGMDGYINMSRNKDNNCGIATQASYPVVE